MTEHHTFLALDPGSRETAWVSFVRGQVAGFAKEPNARVLLRVQAHRAPAAKVICEHVEHYGMNVGADVFATVRWTGRFEQVFVQSDVDEHIGWVRFPRRLVKLELCGTQRVNDTGVRHAVLDIYGGKERAVGSKKAPGPLYGMKADMWQALAVGLAYIRSKDPRWQVAKESGSSSPP